MAKLTTRQKKFCLEYVKTGNATQSAKDVGYSEKTARTIASKLLTKVDIQEYIKKQNVKLETKNIMNANERQVFLTNLILNKETTDTNMSDRLKAIDILNKMQGSYLDKVEITNVMPTWYVLDESEEINE